MNRTIHFETLGCRLNQVESEGAARFFTDSGFSVSMEPFTAKSFDESVALCVVNTCTVTAKAEQKARRIIRMLLKTCPNCAVAVTGCYAQLNKDDILAFCCCNKIYSRLKKTHLGNHNILDIMLYNSLSCNQIYRLNINEEIDFLHYKFGICNHNQKLV